MPRKRLPAGEKKMPLLIMVEGKYLKNIEQAKEVAYLSIVKFAKKNEKSI